MQIQNSVFGVMQVFCLHHTSIYTSVGCLQVFLFWNMQATLEHETWKTSFVCSLFHSTKIIIWKLCTVELLDQILSEAFAIAKQNNLKHCLHILSSVFEEMTSFLVQKNLILQQSGTAISLFLKTLFFVDIPNHCF